jgi:hypothetical protein
MADENTIQTPGQDAATPTENGTDAAVPEDRLDMADVSLAPDSFQDIQFQEDPLSEIPGVDGLPENERENIRKSLLRKHAALDQQAKQLQDREAQYMEALERLAVGKQPEPEAQTSFEGMSPEQIVESISERVARKVAADQIKSLGLDKTKETTDAVVRQLQLIEANRIYPDVGRYQEHLVQLSGILEKEYGRDGAMKFSVADMMHILKGREQAQRRPAQRAASRPQPKPEAAPAKAGVTPSAVEPAPNLSPSMMEAFRMAQEKHGQLNSNLNG